MDFDIYVVTAFVEASRQAWWFCGGG